MARNKKSNKKNSTKRGGQNPHAAAAYNSVKGFTDRLQARDLESCLKAKANTVKNEGHHPLEDSRPVYNTPVASTKKTSATTVASACILGVIIFMTSFAFGARNTPSPQNQDTPATTQSF